MLGVDPAKGLARLREAAETGALDDLCQRFGVRVLGAFGSACRPGEAAADLDIAVGFLGDADVMGLLDALVALTDCDVIDLAVIDGAGAVLHAEALVGVPLYEHAPGVYAVEQMAALAERRDTAWLRRLELDALAG